MQSYEFFFYYANFSGVFFLKGVNVCGFKGAKRDYPGVETPGHEDAKSPGLGGLGLVVRLFMGYFTDTVMLPVVVPERKRST